MVRFPASDVLRLSMVRPLLAALLISIAPGGFALAQGQGSGGVRVIEAKKAFPYMDRFLTLPRESRDGLNLSYKMRSKDGAAPPRMNYLVGDRRTPILVAANGTVLNPPDLTILNTGKIEIESAQRKGSISLDIDPVIPLSRAIPVSAVNNALDDFANAIRLVAPAPMRMLAPRVKGVSFGGGAGGQAVFSDGRRVPLLQTNQGARFEPGSAAMRGAVALVFERAPSVAAFVD